MQVEVDELETTHLLAQLTRHILNAIIEARDLDTEVARLLWPSRAGRYGGCKPSSRGEQAHLPVRLVCPAVQHCVGIVVHVELVGQERLVFWGIGQLMARVGRQGRRTDERVGRHG
jgi:hypothetical protein